MFEIAVTIQAASNRTLARRQRSALSIGDSEFMTTTALRQQHADRCAARNVKSSPGRWLLELVDDHDFPGASFSE
jgi:hypothetical protein